MYFNHVILFVVFFQSCYLFAQQENSWISVDNTTKYTFDHIKINNLSDYSFFLHGETHTVSSSPETKLEFLKYYYEKANVRNLVIEAGYASALLFNLYLKTGDESYVCKDYNYFSHREYRKFWRDVYTFNKSLSEPICVIGIDDYETRLVWFKAIEVLFRDKAYENKLIGHDVINQIISVINSINDLADFDHIDRNDMDDLKTQFILNYRNNLDAYSEILQDDSLHLKFIIQNDVSKLRTRTTNKLMSENLHELIDAKQVNNGNFFGQFGSAHVENHNRSLTHYLNDIDESYFKGKVLTVLPVYQNCRMSDLSLEGKGVNTIVYPIRGKKMKVVSHYHTTYVLDELKNKRNNPLKYMLYVKNKDAMRFDFPKSCD